MNANCRRMMSLGRGLGLALGLSACASDSGSGGGTGATGGTTGPGPVGGQATGGTAIPAGDAQTGGSATAQDAAVGGAVVPLTDAAPPTSPPTSPPETDAAVGGAVVPMTDAAVPPGPDLGTGYGSCAEAPVGVTECFSNRDCPAGRVCRNIGVPGDVEVPCCVEGPRGDLPAGTPCDPARGETQCASSICIEGDTGAFCSDVCQTPEDCPEGMRVCQYIAFSTSEDLWCFPETPE
jgi:hypothetical protein